MTNKVKMLKYKMVENKKGLSSRYSHRGYNGSPTAKRDLMKPVNPPVSEYQEEILNTKEKADMNTNLTKALDDLYKVEALMYAIERSCLDSSVMPESQQKFNYGTGAFYALWDAIRKVGEDLDLLAGDETVVDAIYAVNDAKRQARPLKKEN